MSEYAPKSIPQSDTLNPSQDAELTAREQKYTGDGNRVSFWYGEGGRGYTRSGHVQYLYIEKGVVTARILTDDGNVNKTELDIPEAKLRPISTR